MARAGPCLKFVKSQLDSSKVRAWKNLTQQSDDCFTAGRAVKWVPDDPMVQAKVQANHATGDFDKFLRLVKGGHKIYSVEY